MNGEFGYNIADITLLWKAVKGAEWADRVLSQTKPNGIEFVEATVVKLQSDMVLSAGADFPNVGEA